MTLLEVIKRSTEYLANKQVDSPRLQAELIVAHVLKVPRLRLYLDFERHPSEGELGTMRALVKRRGDREPLQYLLGSTSFCGLEIRVTPAVLIPRPETEMLVEQAWSWLAGRTSPIAVLDFATGSGCIAVAIATKFPEARVHAIDVSAEALAVARRNADSHRANIHFHHAASIAEVPSPERFDLILSNPPYIPDEEIRTLQPEVRDHEPLVALAGGSDGLRFHRMIAQEAASRLSGDGKLMVELGDDQAESARAVFAENGWKVDAVLPDYAGRPRILIARR